LAIRLIHNNWLESPVGLSYTSCVHAAVKFLVVYESILKTLNLPNINIAINGLFGKPTVWTVSEVLEVTCIHNHDSSIVFLVSSVFLSSFSLRMEVLRIHPLSTFFITF
jgi:hypothetical protein